MKKYSFALEQVRRVRRAEEDLAKGHLLSANNEVTQAIAATEARMERYSQVSDPAMGSTGVDAFMRSRYFTGLAGQAVTVSLQSQAAAELQADERRADWRNAATKVKALDRLDERRRVEHQLEADREAEKEVDDIVTGRYMRQRAEGNP